MRIRELIKRTGVTERQVRYLISEGFMPSPAGGRANAEYGTEHIAAIDRYGRLRDLGFPPAAIKLLLQAREGVPLPVVEGITLVIAPEHFASGSPIEPVIAQIEALLSNVFREGQNGNDDNDEG